MEDRITTTGGLMLVILSSLLLLEFGCKRESELNQEHAIAKLEQAGATVERDLTIPERPVIGVTFSSLHVLDAALTYLDGLTDLQILSLTDNPLITDAGLAHVRGLTNLQALDLSGDTALTDAGLNHLKMLTNLRTLNLSRNPAITRAGLRKLKRSLPMTEIRR